MNRFHLICLFFCLVTTNAGAQSFSGSHKYKASVLINDFNRPWGLRFSPDNKLYVTEKAGKIWVIENGKRSHQVSGIPEDLRVVGQGGLMDLVFHPRFAENNFIYLSYSTNVNANPQNGYNTRVSRFQLVDKKLSGEKIIIQGAYGTDSAHFGGGLAFDKDEKLYISFGERHFKELAQDLKYLNGKVVRLNDDGSIPEDNPFVKNKEALASIWTYGHRNPQGVDIHPESNQAFVSEHGPSGYDAELPGVGPIGKADEVNSLMPGGNYGWPILFGDPEILPWTEEMLKFAETPNVIPPYKEFTLPDGIAPGGASFYSGDQFPKWKNSFFVAALRGYLVRVFEDANGKVTTERIVPRGYRRIRDVIEGPDGFVYFITNNQLVQIQPE